MKNKTIIQKKKNNGKTEYIGRASCAFADGEMTHGTEKHTAFEFVRGVISARNNRCVVFYCVVLS